MPPAIRDYSELSPEERLQLVADIWDSLVLQSPEAVPVPESHVQELDRRLHAYQQDPDPGRPWREALDAVDEELTR